MKSAYGSVLGLGIQLFLSISALAQELSVPDSGRSYFLATKFQTGYIIKNASRVGPLIKNHPWTFQVDFSVLKNTQRAWNYCQCYTKTGVSLSYVDFGNSANLGHALNLIVFTEPYLFFSRRIQFTLRGGAGFSYLNKIYNTDTNPNNIFYSKHLSFLLMLNTTMYYSLSPQVRLSLSAQFNHISNGGTHTPNLGMNFPTVGIGLEYKIDSRELPHREHKPFINRSPKLMVRFFSGSHTVDATPLLPEEKLIVMGVNTGVIKPLTRVNGLGIGGELYYDEASKALQVRSGEKFSTWIGSVSLQHYIFFGKLIFSQQLAYYVTPLNPHVNTRFYQRYFLEYQIMGPWYAGISLKAHGDESDYVAFTVNRIFTLH